MNWHMQPGRGLSLIFFHILSTLITNAAFNFSIVMQHLVVWISVLSLSAQFYLELIQGTCRLRLKMGRGDEQKPLMTVSDGNQY